MRLPSTRACCLSGASSMRRSPSTTVGREWRPSWRNANPIFRIARCLVDKGSFMGPLAGYRVIEMAGIGPAPFAAMLLADMGAEVIRIDRKGRSDASAFDVLKNGGFLNRGRRSLALDLKNPEAVAAVLRLVGEAHAILEGFRPGVMERLGLGPEPCLQRNPRLVYGRITGWGQSGPLAQAAGHDINYIALTGALHAIGTAGKPVAPLNLVGDFGGGAMFVAFGIVCALLEAGKSGRGQVVDAAMTDVHTEGHHVAELAGGGIESEIALAFADGVHDHGAFDAGIVGDLPGGLFQRLA